MEENIDLFRPVSDKMNTMTPLREQDSYPYPSPYPHLASYKTRSGHLNEVRSS